MYVCPVCSTQTGFDWKDFERHAKGAHSNLSVADQRVIEAKAQSRLGSENAFVDFYCPGCNQAVRTY